MVVTKIAFETDTTRLIASRSEDGLKLQLDGQSHCTFLSNACPLGQASMRAIELCGGPGMNDKGWSEVFSYVAKALSILQPPPERRTTCTPIES